MHQKCPFKMYNQVLDNWFSA